MSGKGLAHVRLMLTFVLAVVVLFVAGVPSAAGGTLGSDGWQRAEPAGNLLVNGGFEEGDGDGPTGWERDTFDPAVEMVWDDSVAFTGSRSIRITAVTPNDTRWLQTVAVEPNTLYRLSGWVKTEKVGYSAETVDAGANLSLFGTWSRSSALIGTHDWTYVMLDFNSEAASEITVAARLGYWSGTTAGTVWFEDLRLTPLTVEPTAPHPDWKMLTLIYPITDFVYRDSTGRERHVVGQMTAMEIEQAAAASELFGAVDIPALTSGNMIPTMTVRVVEHALATLDPYIGDTWWPSPGNTEAERDPAFDSVIVIWQPWVVDQVTGELFFITGAEGLTPTMWAGQTYTTFTLDGAIYRGHRNVFKHEWGHSITAYYEAIGVGPRPAVNNHIGPDNMYVHCPSGEPYVLVDETLANPIPNSIYNNESGFTHDYYSGTTAQPEEPNRCLGITPEAWATGGPVTKMMPEFEFGLEPVENRQTGGAGSAVLYALTVTNKGEVSDIYDVVVFEDSGWTVTAPSTTGPLTPGSSGTVEVRVDIPPEALAAMTSKTVVTVTSRGNPDQTAEANLTTTVVMETIPVTIDIRPQNSQNVINIRSRGTVPVAILSTSDFDAPGQVNPTTLRFGHTGSEASLTAPTKCKERDVNRDGLDDLTCHFALRLAAFEPGDRLGCLTGATVDGVAISGSDKVRVMR